MHKPLIVIRAANSTYDEGLLCGHYLNEAAEGFFRFMLGRKFSQIIAKAYIQPNHSYSFQHVSFAEYDHRIVGMALGFTSENYRRFSDQPINEAAGCHYLRMRFVKTLCAPMLRMMESIPDGDFYLLAMAIDKDFRGAGLASALMDSSIERARESGSERLSLDVSANNELARRIYEKWGMTIESQWPRRLNIPALRFYRMAMDV